MRCSEKALQRGLNRHRRHAEVNYEIESPKTSRFCIPGNIADSCSRLHTVSLGLANTGLSGPALWENTCALGPAFSAHESTLVMAWRMVKCTSETRPLHHLACVFSSHKIFSVFVSSSVMLDFSEEGILASTSSLLMLTLPTALPAPSPAADSFCPNARTYTWSPSVDALRPLLID